MNKTIRRGQTAFYVNVEHGDFYKVADLLEDMSDKLNIGWIIRDSFVSKLVAKDPEALNRLKKIIKLRASTGKGYITKLDTMKRNRAEVFKILGLEAKGSNLCVAPETEILTRNGYQIISELEGHEVEVWNGEEWSLTTVVKTGENQKLIKVVVETFSNGVTFDKALVCTEYHKWYDASGVEIRTKDLKVGVELLGWVDPDGNSVTSTIKEIVDEGRYDDTYCFTEPKRHMGVFNGILTGQCVELNLPANDEYTFSCPIINANLSLYDEFPEHLFQLIQIMQDCNVSGYLEQIESKKGFAKLFLSKIYKFTKDFRATGMGTCGFHSLLMQRGYPVGSFEAMVLNEEIFKRQRDDTREASQWLGDVLGTPEGIAKAGKTYRNATTMFAPPTKGSVELTRNTPSEGVSLETALVKVKETTGGDIFRINYEFLKFLKKRGLYKPEIIEQVAKDKGSCQNVKEMTDEEKYLFRIAFEVPVEDHLDLCAQRQPFFDQQQSINLAFSGNDDEEYIGAMHMKALLDDNINALYYNYGVRGATHKRIKECAVCQ